MGPAVEDPEEMRPYFRAARSLFDRLREEELPGAGIRTLSMGMSDSWAVAVTEGATMIRPGTVIFGPRPG